MIKGIGIDIIEVLRVAEKLGKGNGFREKVFSEQEIAFCDSKANRHEHYAARFAAKEAFLKATGHGLWLELELRHIEIVQDDLGKPLLNLKDVFKVKAEEHGWTRIHVSLSHIKDAACAVVVIES